MKNEEFIGGIDPNKVSKQFVEIILKSAPVAFKEDYDPEEYITKSFNELYPNHITEIEEWEDDYVKLAFRDKKTGFIVGVRINQPKL